jgi:hypothetical protein
VAIDRADHLRNLGEAAVAVAKPYSLRLVAREAARAHRRPVRGVLDDDLVAAGDLREVVPIALVA